MADCPTCGFRNTAGADFCQNPDCRAYLGFSTGVVRAPDPSQSGAGPAYQQPPHQPPTQYQAPPQQAPQPQYHAPQTSAYQQPPVQASGPHRPPGPQSYGPQSFGPQSTGGTPAQRRGVRLRLETAELTAEPGGVVTTTATVRNTGTRVEEFRLVVRGPAAEFGAVDPPALSVYPDDERTAVVRFSPERSARHPAGRARSTCWCPRASTPTSGRPSRAASRSTRSTSSTRRSSPR
ncbi:hypothetical protein BJF78_17630 [Pseudonocardia sp. CNS-139]|nr:hypothetical protein BJF78_17630 [Pseudonocardia sp. CNS-139]